METEEEVLFRQLKTLAIAIEADEAKPPAVDQTSQFELARVAAGVDGEVRSTNNLRKIIFSPLILRLLVEMRPLGESFTSSSFFKVPYLAKLQGDFAGVSCSSFLCIVPSC